MKQNMKPGKCKLPKLFKEEWDLLTNKGVPFRFKIGPGEIKGKWLWESNFEANLFDWNFVITDKNFQKKLKALTGSQYEWAMDNIRDFIDIDKCLNSPSLRQVNKRIKDFCKKTEDYGKKTYDDKHYLWNNYFWKQICT